MDVKEALRLQKENNFVILDVRPEAEFKEVIYFIFSPKFNIIKIVFYIFISLKARICILYVGSPPRCYQRANIQAYKGVDGMGYC